MTLKNRKRLGFAMVILPVIALYLLITLEREFSFTVSMVVIFTSIMFILIGLPLIYVSGEKGRRNSLKKIFFISSIFLILAGVTGRFMHLPMASLFLVFGTVIYCFGFSPMELIDKYNKWRPFTRNRTESFLLSSVDYIGYTAFSLLIMFKLNHWPGAMYLLIIGGIGFAAGLLAWNNLFKKEVIKRKESEDRIKQQYSEIQDSIKYAKRIQTAILPQPSMLNELLGEYFILYLPKDIVAGDFYWLDSKDGKLLVAAADCTGHGVPGAIVSVICNNGLNRSVWEYDLSDPGKILDKTREIIVHEFEKSEENVRDGMDIALCSLEGSELKFSGANNPLWIIRKGSDEVEEIKADKQPVGKFQNPQPYSTTSVKLNDRDTIYLFSDGFADQFGGPSGKKYKYKPLKDFLLGISHLPMAEQGKKTEEEFLRWKGDLDQVDDVLLMGIRFDGKG